MYYSKNQKEIERLKKEMAQPGFWYTKSNQDRINKLMQEDNLIQNRASNAELMYPSMHKSTNQNTVNNNSFIKRLETKEKQNEKSIAKLFYPSMSTPTATIIQKGREYEFGSKPASNSQQSLKTLLGRDNWDYLTEKPETVKKLPDIIEPNNRHDYNKDQLITKISNEQGNRQQGENYKQYKQEVHNFRLDERTEQNKQKDMSQEMAKSKAPDSTFPFEPSQTKPNHVQTKINTYNVGVDSLQNEAKEITREKPTVKYYRQGKRPDLNHIKKNQDYFYALLDPNKEAFGENRTDINLQAMQNIYPQLTNMEPEQVEQALAKINAISQEKSEEKEYYRVGERNLDSSGSLSSSSSSSESEKDDSDTPIQFKDSNHMPLHQHLIGSDGTDVGYSGDGGIGSDKPELLENMVESKEFKGIKLDKKYIDTAIDILKESYTEENYGLFTNNCQHFVDDSIRLANELASFKGESVFVE